MPAHARLQILRGSGVWGLYRGAGPSVMRAFIVSSLRWTAYHGAIARLDGSTGEAEDQRGKRTATITGPTE